MTALSFVWVHPYSQISGCDINKKKLHRFIIIDIAVSKPTCLAHWTSETWSTGTCQVNSVRYTCAVVLARNTAAWILNRTKLCKAMYIIRSGIKIKTKVSTILQFKSYIYLLNLIF